MVAAAAAVVATASVMRIIMGSRNSNSDSTCERNSEMDRTINGNTRIMNLNHLTGSRSRMRVVATITVLNVAMPVEI